MDKLLYCLLALNIISITMWYISEYRREKAAKQAKLMYSRNVELQNEVEAERYKGRLYREVR